MNNGSKSSDYSAWDRYYRQAKVQWQKTNGSVNFEQRNYTYDRMGNRLTMDNSGSGGGGSNWDETYVYDGLNRLTTFKRGTISSGVISSPKFQQTWSLDSLGNWRGYDQTNNDTGLLPVATYPTFSQTRTNNAVNEITGTSGGSFASTAYDSAGNLTQGPKTGAESTSVYFKYDAWNRQASLDANGDDDLFDNGDWQYEYDGIGRRISKWQDTANDGNNSAGAGEEFYYNEDYQIVEVRVATTTGGAKTIKSDPRERMLWDLTYVDSPALVEIDSDSNGSRDFRLWPMWDANKNVTGLLSDDGVTVERYAYTPYGQQIILNGDQNYDDTGADPDGNEWTVDTNGSDFSYGGSGFQGLRWDAESGNWYQRARYNSPVLQFTQRDPILYAGGTMNLFQYLASNPTRTVDPLGRMPEEIPLVPDYTREPTPDGPDHYFWDGDNPFSQDDDFIDERNFTPDKEPPSERPPSQPQTPNTPDEPDEPAGQPVGRLAFFLWLMTSGISDTPKRSAERPIPRGPLADKECGDCVVASFLYLWEVDQKDMNITGSAKKVRTIRDVTKAQCDALSVPRSKRTISTPTVTRPVYVVQEFERYTEWRPKDA